MEKMESRPNSKKNRLNNDLITIILSLTGIFSIIILLISELFIYSIFNGGQIESLFSLNNVLSYYFMINLSYSLLIITFLSIILIKKIKKLRYNTYESHKSFENIKSEVNKIPQNDINRNLDKENFKYLDEKEKIVLDFIINNGGKILQKNLVGYEGLTRPTVSRIIDKLERKGLIIKVRHGSTYIIYLKE